MLSAAITAAKRAGEAIRGHTPTGIRHKGVIDLVTEVDLMAEELIRDTLGKLTPSIPILAEEQGGPRNASTKWIVDPLDGTTNFVHGFPFYCVSIALEVDGALTVGVIYDPVRDLTYSAEVGKGAFVGDRRLKVSKVPDLNSAVIASGFAYDRRERADFYLSYVKAFLKKTQGFRRCGSAAMDLVMVARGELDGYWEFGLNSWDIAAGALIVQEAGGRVSEVDGNPLILHKPSILASNGLIHPEMLQTIADISCGD
jgi:myo-inositol-1(or 4)-monophosphatase